MAGNSALIPVQVRDWRGGLDNLSRTGFHQWWGTSLWWTMALMWAGIINGILAGILWTNPEKNMAQEGIGIYGIFAGLFVPIAVVIIMQDALVGEKETGTAAWVLSKPVTRTAFILSKVIPNAVGIWVTMVVLPGLVAYGQLSAAAGRLLSPLGFLGTLVALGAIQLFFLTLTLMLGTFFDHRGGVIGIPLAFNFLQQTLAGGLPFLQPILPWTLINPDTGQYGITALLLGQPLASWVPLIAAFVWSGIFIALSLWRFQKTEL